MKIIVKTFHGLEPVLADELKALGMHDCIQVNRAVVLEGDLTWLYRCNYELYTALRVLLPVIEFDAANEHEFYQKIYDYNWSEYMDLKNTFSIDSVVKSDRFRNSKYIALKAKDAIADHFRNKYGKRPNVNTINPDVRFNVHIYENKCTISLDSSGSSLHKRGYRIHSVEAPINEVMAAGLIKLSGWNGDQTFIDPMCGSGTLVLEAAMIASQTPPNFLREEFGFQKWKNFDSQIWNQVKNAAQSRRKEVNQIILGMDRHLKALRGAHMNAIEAQLDKYILFEKYDFFKYQPRHKPLTLITNPPYEKRIKTGDINTFYKQIGDKLKQDFSACSAWIFSGNLEALKHIGLKASTRYNMYNGPIPSKFLKFELYEGSKKSKYNKD